jgi:hypothetical protein
MAQSKERIKVTDMLQMKSIGSVWITDDGSKAAFSVLNIEPDTAKWEYKYVTQIWTVNTDGSHLETVNFRKGTELHNQNGAMMENNLRSFGRLTVSLKYSS